MHPLNPFAFPQQRDREKEQGEEAKGQIPQHLQVQWTTSSTAPTD